MLGFWKIMNINRSFLSLVTLFSLGVLSFSQTVTNIQVEVDDKPSFEDIISPDLNGGNAKKWDPLEWLEMEIQFEVTKALPKSATHVDEVRIKWYAAVLNPDKKSKAKYVLLEKEITHINIPVGKEVYSSVYLSPASVHRISGKERASKGILEAVGGEIFFNGEKKAQFSSKGKGEWWNSGKMSRYERIPLLSKDKTPFAFSWWDRYAENKPERR